MILNTLIFICGAILLISAMFTTLMWFKYRHALIKNLLFFWISGIASFIAQGLFNNLQVSGLICFGMNVVTIIYFLKIFADGMGFKLPFRIYYLVLTFSLLTGCILLGTGVADFRLSSGIFCLACAGTIFHGAFSNIKAARVDSVSFVYRVLLVFDGAHFLDYPFFRQDVSLSVFGFSITLVFFFCFAVYVPIFILRKISLDYTNLLEVEVDIKTRELKELSEMNRALLSIVCHDLASPLTVLQVSSKQLFNAVSAVESFQNPMFNQNKMRFESSIQAIKEILTKVRNLQSFRSGKATLSLVPIHPMRTLTETLTLFEDRLKEKNIKIEIENHLDDSEHFLGDYTIVKHQILGNLISNAVKFSPRGSSIVIVITQENGKGVIEVKDNGIGIPEKLLPRIFDFHVATTRPGTENEPGTGFGLPLVKTCVELMGGSIEVRSQTVAQSDERTGTTFRIHMNRAAS